MEFFDPIWTAITKYGMPIVQCYHLLTGNVFLNTAAEDATGLEKMGNEILTPFQYLFAGHKIEVVDGTYHSDLRFDYRDGMWTKTAAAIVALPVSLTTGVVVKGLAYCFPETRDRHDRIVDSLHTNPIESQNYAAMGLNIGNWQEGEIMPPRGFQRRPGEEKVLATEKEALREIVRVLTDAQIPFWVDCGTCLGAYRYGGIIPWDNDVDLAILQPDFENAKLALRSLDPEKYVVQDWSSRDLPHSYLKIYVRETAALIDIYHFAIEPETKVIHSILANEGSVFLPDSWKIRERRFKIDTPFEVVFPLKRAIFDGIEVPVPNNTEKYLQMRYGENLGPIKIYNPITDAYEKDLSHPYWKLPYVY